MDGPIIDTWRQISEPIEPPAPVTSTRRPSMDWRTASRSVGTGVRPRRSSICGARAWRRAARWLGSLSMSRTPGRIFMDTSASSAARSDRSTSSGEGLGMARRTCWMV